MSGSTVFWDLFSTTGRIGLYLLYKHASAEGVGLQNEDDPERDQDLMEVSSERG